jgi:hypothetical protein
MRWLLPWLLKPQVVKRKKIAVPGVTITGLILSC